MTTSLTFSFVILFAFSAYAQLQGDDYTLPETWSKEFSIDLSYRSSMSGASTQIHFTHDSCTYKASSRNTAPKEKRYLLTEKDRVALLQRLHELKADRIKSETTYHLVRDGWSQSLCFGAHCIEGGTSVEMSTENKNTFLDSYRYLEEFAIKKTK